MSFDRLAGRSMHRSISHPGLHPDIWAGFKPTETELEGIITDVNIDTADPTLQVRGPDGRNWTVELADRRQSQAIGLKRAAMLPGDRLRVRGRRTQRFGEQRIKALHLVIEGRAFDLFPETCAEAEPA